MKNLIYKNILAAGVIALSTAFVSCDEDDTSGLDSLGKTTATTTVTSLTIAEGDTGMIPFTIAKPSNKPSQFKIQVMGGTATEDADYTAGDQDMDGDTGAPGEGFEITIPAYVTSFNIPVKTILDIYPEGDETIQLNISAAGVRTVLIEGGSVDVNVTINNTESTDFLWRMSWDSNFIGTDGAEHSFCDEIDLDLEIYDAGFGGPLATSYGDCPEEILSAMGDLADGDYWLVPSYWDHTALIPPGLTIPTSMIFAKPGVWFQELDLSDVWNTTDGGNQQGNANAYLVKYQLNVAGNVYTVTDMDTGSVIGTGKSAGFTPGARALK